MATSLSEFNNQGYLIIDRLVNDGELEQIIEHCESEFTSRVGTRNLLRNNYVKLLADKLLNHNQLKLFLPKDTKPVQCNYFNKSINDNWSVSLHRDLSIPVAKKMESHKWSGWSVKEGQLYAQPPRAVLESLVVVRIHFEHNDHKNGALRVIPGSHLPDSKESGEVICKVKQGGAVIISPLILHKSPKLQSGTRRVLHFVFGPSSLPDGADWP